MDIITVKKRNEKTKAKQLRRSGIVPCVICGGTLEQSLSVQMEKTVAAKLFKAKREGSKIQIKFEEQVIPAQIKCKTQDMLSNEITHISFQALKADQEVNSVVHIILQNSDKIVGSLEKMLLEIPYSALPANMIDTVTIDLEGMATGSVITVGDISELKNDKIGLQVTTDSVVFRISEKKGLFATPGE